MNKQIITLASLTIVAVALLVANVFLPKASAEVSVIGRDYQMVTARIQGGGDGLYIIDNKTGLIAIFTFDPQTRGVVTRAVRPVADAFPGGH